MITQLVIYWTIGIFQNIAINLSKQIQLENPDLRQKTNFIGKIEDDKATM